MVLQAGTRTSLGNLRNSRSLSLRAPQNNLRLGPLSVIWRRPSYYRYLAVQMRLERRAE